MDVSIIIVNYNTRELTANCIKSVYEKTKGVDFEIILVDNNSNDGSVKYIKEQFPSVIIVENEENLGFGRANNKGALIAKGKYLFLLNSDTILVEDAISVFFAFMEKNNYYSSCGCNLIDANGERTISHGCLPSLMKEFYLLGLYKILPSYFNNHLSDAQTILQGNISNTGYISGADIFIRKNVFDELGGFDDQIFLYFEETDLYYRMREKGYKSCVLDTCKIIHLGGASSSANVRKMKQYVKSMFYYYRKHYTSLYVKFVKLVLFMRVMLFPLENKIGIAKEIVKI